MTVLLTVGVGAVGVAVTFALLVARTLAAKEVNGRIERRVRQHVEATIASLPPPLQDEWADEWRGDLAAVIAMPLEAVRFARNVRRSAVQLVGEPVLAPSRASDVGVFSFRRWQRRDWTSVLRAWILRRTAAQLREGSGPYSIIPSERLSWLVLLMMSLALSTLGFVSIATSSSALTTIAPLATGALSAFAAGYKRR